MNNVIENYLDNHKSLFSVSNSELNHLESEGYVKLSRNEDFWKKHNIDINKFVILAEDLLNQENKRDSNKNDKNTYKPEKGANRISNLIGKNLDFKKFIAIPDIIYLVNKILKDKFRLSSIDLREPLPNHGGQGLHLDWNQRNNLNEKYLQCSAFIYLDDVNENNGPLRLIPKSHIEMIDIKSTSLNQHKRTKKDHKLIEEFDKTKSIKIAAKKGDIVILNMCVFHGGTTNTSGERRRTIFINFRSSKKRQQLNQYDYINKKYHNNFSQFEKEILHLYKPTLKDRIKRFLYDYRNNKLIIIVNKYIILFRKIS